MSQYQTYINDALAHQGWAALDHRVAFWVRPGLWPGGAVMAGADSGGLQVLERILAGRRGILRFRADMTVQGERFNDVALVAFSSAQLAERLTWFGLEVSDIRKVHSFAEARAEVPKAAPKDDQPPPYACEARDAWFDAHPGQIDPLKATARQRWFGGAS